MKKFVDKLRGAQRGSDVLEESRLRRAGLIDRSPPPAPGGDSFMESAGDAFDAFFQAVVGDASGS